MVGSDLRADCLSARPGGRALPREIRSTFEFPIGTCPAKAGADENLDRAPAVTFDAVLRLARFASGAPRARRWTRAHVGFQPFGLPPRCHDSLPHRCRSVRLGWRPLDSSSRHATSASQVSFPVLGLGGSAAAGRSADGFSFRNFRCSRGGRGPRGSKFPRVTG